MSDTLESLRSELAAAKADLERARLALDACKDAHFAAQSQHEERAYALATATARIAELEGALRGLQTAAREVLHADEDLSVECFRRRTTAPLLAPHAEGEPGEER